VDHDVDRVLAEAVAAGDDSGVARALALGADPNVAAGRFRGPVLSEACARGHVSIVRLLLDGGASAAPVDPHTRSPLRAAVQEAHPDVVGIVLACGALAAEPTDRGSVLADAVDYAMHRPQPTALENLRLLLRQGAGPAPDEEAPIVTAVMRRAAPAVLQVLLDHGAQPDQQRSDATPVLVLAARRGDHAAADVLLQAGADVNATDARGRTALMHAVERDERATVAVLRLAGADIDTVSVDGVTARELARGWQRQNIQLMFGQRRAGLDDVPIVRTVMRLVPTGRQMRGDPGTFQVWARVIDRAIEALGASEWKIRTGIASEDAAGFVDRLRHEPVPASGASWHVLNVTVEELAIVRAAFRELAYGSTAPPPDGISHHEIVDLFDELERQLGR